MYACLNARAMGLDLPAAEAIDLASAAGFGGVDLMVRDLVDARHDPRALRAMMDDRGLRGGAWPLPVAWRGDAGTFATDLARLPRYAEAAQVLGLSRTGTWVMPETPERPGAGTDAGSYLASVAALHIERLGAVARVLHAYGTRLGLEVIGVESARTGQGLPFVTRLAELDPRLGAIWGEAPGLGILVDGFHLYAAGEPVEAALAWGVERVVWVHVADLPAGPGVDRGAIRDLERGLPGENGAIDTGLLLRRLAVAGYDGPVTAEPMAACRSLAGLPPEEAAHLVAASLRSAWPGRET